MRSLKGYFTRAPFQKCLSKCIENHIDIGDNYQIQQLAIIADLFYVMH